MDRESTDVRVECYAGYRGEETPRRFFLGTRRVEVSGIVERWLAPDHRGFKLRGDDGIEYILRHHAKAGGWTLTLHGKAGAGDRAP